MIELPPILTRESVKPEWIEEIKEALYLDQKYQLNLAMVETCPASGLHQLLAPLFDTFGVEYTLRHLWIRGDYHHYRQLIIVVDYHERIKAKVNAPDVDEL